MAAPRLNRLLVLETPQRLPDGAGGFTEAWLELGRLWAEITPRSGRETAGAAMPLARVPLKIVVRAAPPGSEARPRPEQRFREETRLYRIEAVTEDDRDARFLVCFAEEEQVA